MVINFTCSECGFSNESPDRYAGCILNCTRCSHRVVVPEPDGRQSDSPKDRPRHRHRMPVKNPPFLVCGIIGVCLLAAVGVSRYIEWQQRYPYGRSHCCDKQLASALFQYAIAHDRKFPAGEATPEASLSLLYRDDRNISAYLLRGKTVPESMVQAILERGELLGPETCGWHYVEGLTLSDDSRLALFWDKTGLGHNGERLPEGGHYVAFVNGFSDYIPAVKWKAFLAEQKRLYAARAKNVIQ